MWVIGVCFQLLHSLDVMQSTSVSKIRENNMYLVIRYNKKNITSVIKENRTSISISCPLRA